MSTDNPLINYRHMAVIDSASFIKIWRSYDKDLSGYIDGGEITQLVSDLLSSENESPSVELVAQIAESFLADFDKNHDGKFSLYELSLLLPVEQNHLKVYAGGASVSREDYDVIFDKYDRNCNGTIANDELSGFAMDLLMAQGREEILMASVDDYAAMILALFDTDKNGELSKEELRPLLMAS